MAGQKREARLRARCPGHPRLSCSSEAKTWMPGTRPGMTTFCYKALFHWLHCESESEVRRRSLSSGRVSRGPVGRVSRDEQHRGLMVRDGAPDSASALPGERL